MEEEEVTSVSARLDCLFYPILIMCISYFCLYAALVISDNPSSHSTSSCTSVCHVCNCCCISCNIAKVLYPHEWRCTSKIEDVLDTDLLKAVETAVKSSLSMKRIKIRGKFINWSNVATTIFKGAAQSM